MATSVFLSVRRIAPGLRSMRSWLLGWLATLPPLVFAFEAGSALNAELGALEPGRLAVGQIL